MIIRAIEMVEMDFRKKSMQKKVVNREPLIWRDISLERSHMLNWKKERETPHNSLSNDAVWFHGYPMHGKGQNTRPKKKKDPEKVFRTCYQNWSVAGIWQ